jgi:alpha-L-fucosidase 2
LTLLPALPKALPKGTVSDLRARGGFLVDLNWTNGVLTLATVPSLGGTNCVVRYAGKTK